MPLINAADSSSWVAEIMKEAEVLVGTIRKNIIDTLVILSSREEQSKYPLPVEWFCFWLDGYYHPKDYLFQRAFTDSELEALSEFNIFLKLSQN